MVCGALLFVATFLVGFFLGFPFGFALGLLGFEDIGWG
jgi:hypothetical protein